ncbi:MAG TPA: TfoX/Sxy family DNA transformation protein [Candidatus Saccharimonas sp.]|nr:TfoX/Sxy family DNA transformation protein [Candidatus Saccharimonas sp.]
MNDNPLQLRNLTSDDLAMLADIGVTTREQFDRMGGDKTYLLLMETGKVSDTDLLYRLRGAERDIDWKILAERDQQRTKSRFVDVDEP